MVESQISALMDGELERDVAGEFLDKIKKQQSLQQDWQMFHLIGDTLRQTPPLSPGFNVRFAERLAKEPTVLAPQRFLQRKHPLIALSAAASVAAISLVAWVALQVNGETGSVGSTAENAAAETRLASSEPAININGYLIAHQEYSHAVQEPSPFQRASLENVQSRGE